MLKVLAVLIAVWAANGYGFSNLVHNKYLLDELNPSNNDMILSRDRRDVEYVSAAKVDNVCCIGDLLEIRYTDEIYKARDQCINLVYSSDFEYVDLFDCDKMARMKDAYICMMECTAVALNYIDENGKFNREKIIKYFRDYEIGDVEWKKDAIEGYLDDCMLKAEANKKINGQNCSHLAADLRLCADAKLFTGCPADLRVDSIQCNDARLLAVVGFT